MKLASEVMRFVSEARSSPASAVSPEKLEALLIAARTDMADAQVALMSPAAPFTMLSRVTLEVTQDSSPVDTIDTFGRPIEIVGLFPSIINLGDDTETNQPPMDAIDVQIARTKGQRNLLTAANQTAQAAEVEPDFVSLAAVSSAIANRTLRYRIEDAQALLSFQYRWAVDQAVRTTKTWATTQISMNIFYRLLTDDLRR